MLERISTGVAITTALAAFALFGALMSEPQTKPAHYILLAFILIFRIKMSFDDFYYFKSRVKDSQNSKIRFVKMGIVAALISWALCGWALFALRDYVLSSYIMGIAILISTIWIAFDAMTQRFEFHPLWIVTNCIYMGVLFTVASYRVRTSPMIECAFGLLVVVTIVDWIFSDSLGPVISESFGANKDK